MAFRLAMVCVVLALLLSFNVVVTNITTYRICLFSCVAAAIYSWFLVGWRLWGRGLGIFVTT